MPPRTKGGGAITRISSVRRRATSSTHCGKRPYDVVKAARTAAVRQRLGATAPCCRSIPNRCGRSRRFPSGEHPNQIALHPTDDRLFVACASSNASRSSTRRRGIVQETIYTALFPQAPEGSTPDALASIPTARRCTSPTPTTTASPSIDIAAPSRSQVKGFIPTGWYPTAVAVTPDGKKLLVGVGKGNQTKPNPIAAKQKPKPADEAAREGGNGALPFPYIGTTLSGALSIVAVPDEKQLAAYTETVYATARIPTSS